MTTPDRRSPISRTAPVAAVILLLCVVVLLSAGTVMAQQAGDIPWRTMQEAQQLAREQERKVLVYAKADWCSYCKRMEREVFPDSTVQQAITRHFYPVKVDVESDSTIRFNGRTLSERRFSSEMRAVATPTFVFIREDGQVLGIQPGFMEKRLFKALLSYIGTDAYKTEEAGAYIKRMEEEGGDPR